MNSSEVSGKEDLQNFCIQRFKPLAKDAEFLHHTLVARKVANLPEIGTCRISAFNFFNRPVALAIIYSIFSAAFGPAVKNTLS